MWGMPADIRCCLKLNDMPYLFTITVAVQRLTALRAVDLTNSLTLTNESLGTALSGASHLSHLVLRVSDMSGLVFEMSGR